jgi:Na+/glutamate symporter
MKNNITAACVGIIVGTIIGLLLSKSMIKDYKNHDMLIKENKMLKDIIMQHQNTY